MQIIQSLLALLDSKPAVIKPGRKDGLRRRGLSGQSLVEIALTTPILFLMVVSTVEVGLLANNYLILLDAVREGGRYAVAQTPLSWNDTQSTRNYYRTACYSTKDDGTGKSIASGYYDMIYGEGLTSAHGPSVTGYSSNSADFPPFSGQKGLFDGVACQVVVAMQPLKFDVTNNAGNSGANLNHDDIAVSVIGYANSGAPSYKMYVTGRYPQTNRMCSNDTRDPFNFAGNTPPNPNPPDKLVRGFVVTGNMVAPYVSIPAGCIGSQFSVGNGGANDLEVLLNSLPDLNLNNATPNGGMVLVEMTWTHHQLFGFPPLSFLGNPTLYVWSAFPVSAAEPTPTPGPTIQFVG